MNMLESDHGPFPYFPVGSKWIHRMLHINDDSNDSDFCNPNTKMYINTGVVTIGIQSDQTFNNR